MDRGRAPGLGSPRTSDPGSVPSDDAGLPRRHPGTAHAALDRMSVGFVLLCLVAAAVPLSILYVLYGPTRSRPILVVPRASLLALPQRARTAPVYQPERVFAAEQASLLANASQRIHLAP